MRNNGNDIEIANNDSLHVSENCKAPPKLCMAGINEPANEKYNSNKKNYPSTTKTEKLQNKVSFSSVEVRSYPLILGDNPGGDGIPLTLSWEYSNKFSLSLDRFEYLRQSRHPRKKNVDELKMNPNRRHIYAKYAGFSNEDITQVMIETNKIRKSRRRTIEHIQRTHYLFLHYDNTKNLLPLLGKFSSMITLRRYIQK